MVENKCGCCLTKVCMMVVTFMTLVNCERYIIRNFNFRDKKKRRHNRYQTSMKRGFMELLKKSACTALALTGYENNKIPDEFLGRFSFWPSLSKNANKTNSILFKITTGMIVHEIWTRYTTMILASSYLECDHEEVLYITSAYMHSYLFLRLSSSSGTPACCFSHQTYLVVPGSQSHGARWNNLQK